jgi:hypothetical protein
VLTTASNSRTENSSVRHGLVLIACFALINHQVSVMVIGGAAAGAAPTISNSSSALMAQVTSRLHCSL